MTRDQLVSAADFVHASFGPDADLDIDDDGSSFITTARATLEGFFTFGPRKGLAPDTRPVTTTHTSGNMG